VAAALAVNQLLSSGTHIIAKATIAALGPLAVALLRFVGAAAALLIHRRLSPGPGRIAGGDRGMVLLLGILVVPVNQGFFLYGLLRSTPSHSALLYALTPLVVLLLSHRLLGEGRVWAKLLGIAVSFAGVLIILLERGLSRDAGTVTGDLLILVAVFAWSLYTVLSKPLLERYDAMTVTTWVIVSGTVLCLPAFAIPGAVPPLASIRPAAWGGLLYLSLGTSVVAYPLWLYALRRLDASKVAIATNAQPILTGVLSWIFFRERFTPGFLLGAALILAGITWVETRREG
jgi:drug/metabolite transporter (DMT)-like permease